MSRLPCDKNIKKYEQFFNKRSPVIRVVPNDLLYFCPLDIELNNFFRKVTFIVVCSEKHFYKF